MVYALQYLREKADASGNGEQEGFETGVYAYETVKLLEDDIRAILEKRQIDACADWQALGGELAEREIPDFDLESLENEYLSAAPEEKDGTLLGAFFLAALAQKSMVTNKIFLSGNLLAGWSVDFREKGFRGIRDFRRLAKELSKKDDIDIFLDALPHDHFDENQLHAFILSGMKDYDRCDITNIDMHHDMFNDNEELDCGNWVSHIKKTIPESNIKWIANPISLEAYGLDKLPIEYDFESIKNKKFDLIFICRSDIWSPPHLDKYFNMIVEQVRMHFDSMFTQEEVLEPRDIKDAVNSIREMNKQMLSEFNQRKANK